MGLTKTVGTAILAGKTAAASGSTLVTDCTTVDTSQSTNALGITVLLTFNAGASLGATLNMYGSYDGTNWDTDPFATGSIGKVSGARSKSFSFIPGPKYVRAQIQNLDTGQSITAITIYAHLQTLV